MQCFKRLRIFGKNAKVSYLSENSVCGWDEEIKYQNNKMNEIHVFADTGA